MYTSSWVAPKADVHSQQRFFYMGQKGEINVDQAHRGYTVAKDGDGFRSVNPLFMKYTPTDGERRAIRDMNGYLFARSSKNIVILQYMRHFPACFQLSVDAHFLSILPPQHGRHFYKC